jgi:hypothetical protein
MKQLTKSEKIQIPLRMKRNDFFFLELAVSLINLSSFVIHIELVTSVLDFCWVDSQLLHPRDDFLVVDVVLSIVFVVDDQLG